MSKNNVIPLKPKDKCLACGYSWVNYPGVHVMRCPSCQSSKIKRYRHPKQKAEKLNVPNKK